MELFRFAALRFLADENLDGRLFWYLDPLSLEAGEEVLAPVGMRDRLQCAVVERTLAARAEDAPYDLALIKKTVARRGERTRMLGDVEALDFGGVRFDEKHYSRYGRVLLSKAEVNAEKFGIRTQIVAPMSEDEGVYREILRGNVLLCGGEGKEIFRRLYALLRGKDRALSSLHLGERELFALAHSLG